MLLAKAYTRVYEGLQDPTVKTKRLFPFEEDHVINKQIKRSKVLHSNQMPNNTGRSYGNNIMKRSNVETLNTLDKKHVSLVEKLQPTNIADYVGQKQVIGADTVLCHLLNKGEIPSMIFWGPPGCGKTSLTNVITCLSRKMLADRVHVRNLSAANSSVKDIREAVAAAKDKSNFGCKTVVIMDEIHRFNKLRQDIFLPHVEAGTFILIGCTTENPSYSLNPALLSRCRVFVLHELTESDVTEILHRAINSMNGSVLGTQEREQVHDGELAKVDSSFESKFHIDNTTVQWLAEACGGDARIALNTLELAALAKLPKRWETSSNNNTAITLEDIKENLKQAHVLSEKETDQSHHTYSALHKSIRAGKANAALYWMARIMAAKEDPVNIARRLVRISSEDVGLADPDALGVAVHTMHGCQMIGMPECDVLLGQCAVYLAKAPKSRLIYNALKAAEKVISEHKGPQPAVPSHIKCRSIEHSR